MPTRRDFLDASTAAALAAIGLHARAAAWPSQPLRIIVPFAPGGTSDVIARLISKPLTDSLGVSVLVDNRTGAAGMLPRLLPAPPMAIRCCCPTWARSPSPP